MTPLRVGVVYELTIAEPPMGSASGDEQCRPGSTARGTFRVLAAGAVMLRLADTAHPAAAALHIPSAWVVHAQACR